MNVIVQWRLCPTLPHLSSLGIKTETDGRGRRTTSFHALSTYYLPVTVLGAVETAVITRGQAPALMELILSPVCAGGEGSARGDTCFEKQSRGRGTRRSKGPEARLKCQR